ncbi:hypothetical protein DSO57_1016637 [Entomophthora muscae]|uniref:Uncharacterized protein n=1 Tax=Entomophthora muscae TaxID=34485 RepID=A0ACC2U372_9FUNG|nr:hypothetical protein DSO57_1016637 [Entomophthora muscae]
MKFAPLTKVTTSRQHKVSHMPALMEPKAPPPIKSVPLTSGVDPKRTSWLVVATVPCWILLVPSLSSHSSLALDGILVGLPARMRGKLSKFSSSLTKSLPCNNISLFSPEPDSTVLHEEDTLGFPLSVKRISSTS